MRTILLLSIFLLSIHSAFADQVRIYGQNKAYANSKIEIKYHSDVFTYSEKKIAELVVDIDGKFEVAFSISETKLIFLSLGIYKPFLYIEPGKEYEIKLPPKKDLSPEQKLNPYFEREEFLIGVANAGSDDLNLLIRKLDDQIDPFINQNFHKIYRKKDKSIAIPFSEQIRKENKNVTNNYFKDYLTYRLGFLEYLAYPNLFVKIEEKYFTNKDLKLNNPAYTSLYKKQYGNFLTGYFSQKESIALDEALKSKSSYQAIYEIMREYPTYKNIALRELIIASSVFDAYTRQFYSRKKSLEILTDLKKHSTNKYNQNLCAKYIEKITHLQKNYPAPDFSFGKYQLANFKGKYLYLNFCNTQVYPCVQDFKEMNKLKAQFGDQIEFFSIACDWDVIKFTDFMSKHKLNWPIVLIGDQQKLIGQYGVKAYPTYILIDPKGNIIKAPAYGPRENIHLEFIKIARDAVRKKHRK